MLDPQSPAPPFEVTCPRGRPIRLRDYRGQRLWLVLSRWSSCPFCALRLERIGQSYADLQQAGVETLVVFPSSHERVRRYMERYGTPFSVGVDPSRKIFDDYEVECSWTGELRTLLTRGAMREAIQKTRMLPIPDDAVNRMPADFLIEKTGTIAHALYGTELGDGFNVDAVLKWAQRASQTRHRRHLQPIPAGSTEPPAISAPR